MKGLMISALLAAAVIFAVTPVASTVYADAYPKDPLKRQALEACFHANPGFNRLLAAERAGCYERLMRAQAPTSLPNQGRQLHIPAANFVDLWQAAGRGHLPQNDIRFQQHNAEALRQLHSATN